MLVHSVDGCGANFTMPNPFAALAVMNPDVPAVRSWIVMRRPCGVSAIVTDSLSPEAMKRSFAGFGMNVDAFELTGFGGPCGTPFLVMNAKFTYSTPTRAWHSRFSCFPLIGSCDRLSMLSAAHHFVGSQLVPTVFQPAQPGG